ncbi:putative dehydrogenase [Kibdelosporangium banguiense]|uniref:Dehydrogenase n=1 Tax=Kibdelosporangium banguiense TaxID=1365924 RepID=A0ABS4T7X3_9PSEU|nr:Gfo/Idh/MocA family oxidoreductase [Kibdelosporangium banguiense]MBP2319961.1 putative dehydrogenase [Kibdelosporangium banguiense]
MRRYAIVGVGNRADMYVGALASEYADAGTVVAWCDPSPTRMSYYDEVLGRAPARYSPDRFDDLLREQRPDVVVVTSPDATHHHYVVAALRAGCDVVVEKPLTTTAEGAQAIADAVRESSGDLVVTFNYRYSPRNSEVRRLIADGAIGRVTSVHFEWVLDTVHGADYFRRWHRDKANSGGLLVHKSSHHFDLVNWWLADVPVTVFALGGLRFYGADNAAERGLGARPERSTGAPGAAADPFALDLSADDKLRRLYLEAEPDNGYVRDLDVFSAGITTEDNLSVLVGYRSGATMSYSLNAHSPWEGYRVAVNGTAGRIELEVVERGHVLPAGAIDPSVSPDRPGGQNPRPAGERLLLQKHWEVAEEIPIPEGDGAHGGGDSQLLEDVFRPGLAEDPLGRRAGVVDGLLSAGVGVAANESLRTGQVAGVTVSPTVRA